MIGLDMLQAIADAKSKALQGEKYSEVRKIAGAIKKARLSNISQIKGVGPSTVQKLADAGITDIDKLRECNFLGEIVTNPITLGVINKFLKE